MFYENMIRLIAFQVLAVIGICFRDSLTVVLLAVDIIDLLQILFGQGIGQVGILALQHLGCLDRVSGHLDIFGIGIDLSLDDVLQLDTVKQCRGLGILC